MDGPEIRPRRILIVTGEDSGDLHGSRLIRAALEADPGLSFFGAGGPRMKQAGCEIIIPGEELAVMGLVEAFGHVPKLLGAFSRLKKILRGTPRPDLLVLVDFAEFNLRLAGTAKRAGVPVLYFVSPQVWAWRRGGLWSIADRVDRLAVIFPFEEEFYRGLDVEVEYVGHPLLDETPPDVNRTEFLREHGLDPQKPVVGLFPGSRSNEIRYIFESILGAAGIVLREKPDVQFLLPVAPSLRIEEIRRPLEQAGVQVSLSRGTLRATAAVCDAAVTVSGTATLETAMAGTPMVIIYKMAPLTHFLARRLVNVPHIGLVNIVAGKRVVPELVQEEATPGAIAGELLKMLEKGDYSQKIRASLAGIRARMGEPGCSARVARMVSEMSLGARGGGIA